jgi:hypothetical protein
MIEFESAAGRSLAQGVKPRPALRPLAPRMPLSRWTATNLAPHAVGNPAQLGSWFSVVCSRVLAEKSGSEHG